MATKTSIVNSALIHLGKSKLIANIDSERSAEAIVANNVYDTSLSYVLRLYNWNFARSYRTLGLVSEDTSNTALWKYIYRYPISCAKIRRIMPSPALYSYPHVLSIPYEIGIDSQGRVIYTNHKDAVIEYTQAVTDVSFFPADFQLCLSYYLAHSMAPAITGGDQFNLGAKMLELFADALKTAQYNSMTEERAKQHLDDEVSEYIRFRD
jgi:hypothetical protein